MTTYRISLPWDDLLINVDLAQAAAPLLFRSDDGWEHTPYQTADARHDECAALRLILEYLGHDYFMGPDDDDPDVALRRAVSAAEWSEEDET